MKKEYFIELLNSPISADFCGVPFKKTGKVLKYLVVVSPLRGFRTPILKYFKTAEAAIKFAASLN